MTECQTKTVGKTVLIYKVWMTSEYLENALGTTSGGAPLPFLLPQIQVSSLRIVGFIKVSSLETGKTLE
jgi:hypothetical protein